MRTIKNQAILSILIYLLLSDDKLPKLTQGTMFNVLLRKRIKEIWSLNVRINVSNVVF